MSLGGFLPLDTPILDMLSSNAAQLLTDAAKLATKEDLFKIREKFSRFDSPFIRTHIGLSETVGHDVWPPPTTPVRATVDTLTFQDLRSIEDAFDFHVQSGGIQTQVGTRGDVSACCCCTPCCSTAASVTRPIANP